MKSLIAFSKLLTDDPSLGEYLRSLSTYPDILYGQENLICRYTTHILRRSPNSTHLGVFGGHVSIWDVQDDDTHMRFGCESFRVLAATAGPRLLTITRVAIDDIRSCKGFEARSPVVFSHFSSLRLLHGRMNIRFTLDAQNNTWHRNIEQILKKYSNYFQDFFSIFFFEKSKKY